MPALRLRDPRLLDSRLGSRLELGEEHTEHFDPLLAPEGSDPGSQVVNLCRHQPREGMQSASLALLRIPF